jgi:hypothetical protein
VARVGGCARLPGRGLAAIEEGTVRLCV